MFDFIGELDEKMTVQRETISDDGAGGQISTWANVTPDVWMHVKPTRGGEQIVSEQQRAVNGYDIIVRNLGVGASITELDRVVWRGMTLNVRSAPEAGRDSYRMIKIEAGVNT